MCLTTNPAGPFAQRRLLKILGSSEGYVACDGEDRLAASALEKRGWAEWKGTSWGSSFWAVTAAGRAKIAEWSTSE